MTTTDNTSVRQGPIGVFDSGIGGVYYASRLRQALPHEDFIYYGDTARMPFGRRSPGELRGICREAIGFLVDRRCRAIVLACHSVSTVAAEVIAQMRCPVPVFDIIRPTVSYILGHYNEATIGVIGTSATIRSGIFAELLEAHPGLRVRQLATPALVDLIETGHVNDDTCLDTLRDYLIRPELREIDALVLGCTHYAIIAESVSKVLPARVAIVDSPAIIVGHVTARLQEHGGLHGSGGGSVQCFATKGSELLTEFVRQRLTGAAVSLAGHNPSGGAWVADGLSQRNERQGSPAPSA